MPTGHVIVCGAEGIAIRIVEQLIEAGEAVVVLDEFTAGAAKTLTGAGIATARAIICVTGSDVGNLEFALLARELRSEIPIVTQLSNHAIGHAMAAGNGPGAVLDVATLAAPSVVEACLSRRVHPLNVAGVEFLTASVPIRTEGTLRSKFGDLAPVAVIRPRPDLNTFQVIPCPGRDFVVGRGDRAAVLGTREAFVRAEQVLETEPGEAQVGAGPSPLRIALIKAVWLARDLDRGLYLAIGWLITLVLISTTVLAMGYRQPGMSVLDAIYFSVETVATVGYGDFTFADQEPWLRVWAIFLMGAGITSTAVLMAFLADLLISRRLGHAAGARQARTMSEHVVVVGLGSFGMQVTTELLAAGRSVVVIERNEQNRFIGAAGALGVPIIFGDATQQSTLEAAQVRKAAAVAVMTSDDMANIETGLAVRDLLGERFNRGAEFPIVMRVFDRSLAQAVAKRFTFNHVQPTEEIAAPWFVGAALGLDVLHTFSIESQTFIVGRVGVEAGGGLAGVAMHELSANTRVIALSRAATGLLEHPPRRGTRFEPGDLAYLIGPYQELFGVLERARASSVRPGSAR